MRLKSIFNRPTIYSFIFSLVIIIPLFFDVFIIKYGLKLFLLILLFLINFIITYYDITRYPLKISLENLPELMVKSLFGDNYHNYRSNVMFYYKRKNILKMHYRYNMMGADDRNFEINISKYSDLCASTAFFKKTTAIMEVEDSDSHKRLVSKGQIWKEMKSVMSVPIYNKNKKKIIGILNIDSKLDAEKAKFYESKTNTILNAYADIISDTVG